MRVLIAALCLLSVACQGDIEGVIAPEEASGETTSNDSPSDSEDAEDETEEDDAVPVEELGELVGIEMEIIYESTVDDTLICAKRVEVTGTPYTGDCEGCDFAFSVEGTVIEDNSSPLCYVSDYKLMVADGSIQNVVFAHADLLELGEGDTAASYSDAVFVRYDLIGYMGVYGPYTQVLSHADGADDIGIFRRTDEDFEWGAEQEGVNNGEDVIVDYCEWDYESSWADFSVSSGFTTATESVSCDGRQVDIWTLDIESAMTIGLAVDTVDVETAFDPRMVILGPDECLTATADDNFTCTFEPDRYECPAIELEVERGEYQVMVHSMVDVCAEGLEMGEYTLTVEADTPVRPSLAEDDIHRFEQIPTTTAHEAEGRLIFE